MLDGFDEVEKDAREANQLKQDMSLAQKLQNEEDGKSSGTKYQTSMQVERTVRTTQIIESQGNLGAGGRDEADMFVYVPKEEVTVDQGKIDKEMAKVNEERHKRVTKTVAMEDSMKKLSAMTDDFFSQM